MNNRWRYHAAMRRKEIKSMSISRDRVRFILDTFCDNATRSAFHKAFGTDVPPAPGPITTITVVCRPSQFARFLIYRNDNGGKNSFKDLSPLLFTPETAKREIDVSGNPAG